jgi:formylglycine-generating enzyme required for sulfatase activity
MVHVAVHRVFSFDRFALDLARGSLHVGEQEIELRPKAFEVLKYLVENAGRLINKEELSEAVWPNVVVSDDSITQCIRELRSKLGDNSRTLIKTVSRRGYLLDVVVTMEAPERVSEPSPAMPLEPPQARTEESLLVEPGTAHKGPVWAAVTTILLGVAWWVIYFLGWSVSLTNPASVTHAKNAPAAHQPQPSFRDCADCPEMVALPAGEFMMGSPENERGRLDAEGVPRRVVIPRRIAIGKFEVTVGQIAAFTAETGMTVGGSCHAIVKPEHSSPTWSGPDASLQHPGFDISGSDPAVCISWHEAQSYVAWLQRRTGKPYRLPTEAEWEYAARAGTTTRYSFGNDETELCAYARFADLGSEFGWGDGCRSEFDAAGPVPVGSLKPNPWGLFDMHGNVWEWAEDCWTPNPLEIPVDGSAFSRPGTCEVGVVRGGSFAAGSRRVRSAIRIPVRTAKHLYNTGLRVALPLDD